MAAVMFVTLNIVDAYLTRTALAVGAVEANPLMTWAGSNMITKGLMAIAVVFILYRFGKERALWLLNFLLLGVILWNSAAYWMLALSPSITS